MARKPKSRRSSAKVHVAAGSGSRPGRLASGAANQSAPGNARTLGRKGTPR